MLLPARSVKLYSTYRRTLEDGHKLPPESTDARSPMEKKVLHWLQDSDFFKMNHNAIELHMQFPLGEYHTEQDVYRQKVLESYGYNFLRINRFNVRKDPVETLDQRLVILAQSWA